MLHLGSWKRSMEDLSGEDFGTNWKHLAFVEIGDFGG